MARSLLATALLSLGTPMLLAGDEFGNLQHGNNNAYCQDNALSWLDWRQADAPAGRALTRFAARLIALRKNYPLLRASHFLYGDEEIVLGIASVA